MLLFDYPRHLKSGDSPPPPPPPPPPRSRALGNQIHFYIFNRFKIINRLIERKCERDKYISLTFYDANCKKKLQGDNTSKKKKKPTTEKMHRKKRSRLFRYTTADTGNSIEMMSLYRSSVIDCKVKRKPAAR